MKKRSGARTITRVPRFSGYHTELQKRVAIIGVSLIIILMLVGIGLYVAPMEFVGKAYGDDQFGPAGGSHDGRDNPDEGDNLNQLVETRVWAGGGFRAADDGTSTHCQSREFCAMDIAPGSESDCGDAYCDGDAYCYGPGSIISSFSNTYCAQAFEGEEYVWVRCDSSTQYKRTTDETFICDDPDAPDSYRWIRCTEEGEARGNFRCNGEIWEECGTGTPYLCEGRSTLLECNNAHVFETADQRDSTGTVISEDEYYCSYDGNTYAWIQCASATLGEGVDNAANAPRYGNNYVCSNIFLDIDTTWQPITNCAACAGDLPGSCVGSSVVNIGSGLSLFSNNYYLNSVIDSRIGCVADDECFYGGSQFAPDEMRDDEICTVNHRWSQCPAGSDAEPLAAENSQWLCDGGWRECSESNPASQIGSFICSYDSAQREWQWFSEFSCSPSELYFIRDQDEGTPRICDGTAWLTADDLETENPFTDPSINVIWDIATGSISISELICNNNEDDDNDGLIDCSDESSCSSTQQVTLDEREAYEYVLKQGDCFNVDIDTSRRAYSQLQVCDIGTEPFANRVTLCEAREDSSTPILTLDSTSLLENRFGQPYNDTHDLAFLFVESAPKAVSVMLYRDVSTTQIELPLRTFAPNFIDGQRIMLGVDGESYLLWHPAGVLFSEENLRLTHIGTGEEIPAQIYPGTNRYTFDLIGDRLMTFVVDTPLIAPENQIFRIEVLAPAETPQSIPVPTNLDERFEVTFSKADPIRFIGGRSELGTFSVCRDDNEADPQQVKVCRDNNFDELGFTLKARNLTRREVAGRNYAFLFEVENNTKQVSIFPLVSLGSASSSFAYDPFIDSMVAGRRTAVEFNDKLYLVRHPVASFISLPSLALIRYIGDAATTFTAIGSEDVVDFLIPDGKITLSRNYGDPPPPFSISALHTEEIGPINLDLHLFASMSSLVPVTVNDALVEAADSVYRLDEQVFNINVGGAAHLLHLGQPEVIDDNLFYYHSVIPSEGALLKQVSIYKLYDLTFGSTSRIYDAEFVEQFAGGREFALALNEQYYLMRYENNNNEVLSFNINRIRLSTLDRSVNIIAIPDGAGIRFDLPDGRRLGVEVNYITGALEFNTGVDVLTETPFEPGAYMMELTPSNTVILGAVELRMCRLTAYNGLTSANVCTSTDPLELPHYDFVVNPLPSAAVAPTIVEIDGQQYFFESNGQTGNNKKVFIRRLLRLTPGETWPAVAVPPAPLYWFDFADEIAAGRQPYFAVENKMYVPQVGINSQLSSFQFNAYGVTESATARNIVSNTPIAFNASFALHDRVVHIEQQETTDEERPLSALFFTRAYHYLPDNHDVIRFNATAAAPADLSFVVAVDGIEYQLETISVSPQLVRISLAAGDLQLMNRFFAVGNTRVLNLEGTSVEIKVEILSPEDGILNAQMTVKRQ